MKSMMRFGLIVLIGCLLFGPSAAGAALLLDPASFNTVYSDPQELAQDLAGMDIKNIGYVQSNGSYFFQVEMYGDVGGADYYVINFQNGPLPTGYNWFGNYDTAAILDGGSFNRYTYYRNGDLPITFDAYGKDGHFLQWQISGDLGNFSYWATTQLDQATHIADYAITPIPGAAWLLGSGLVGLIGLGRRRARKA